jgi:transposase
MELNMFLSPIDKPRHMCYHADMYIDVVPNRDSPPAILIRESWREGGKTRKRTVANISDWPPNKIENLRRLLRDETLLPAGVAFAIERSLPHGHVAAVLGTIKKLGLDTIISSKPCHERDLVVAMLAERLIRPCSKLATTRLWHSSTLAGEMNVAGDNANALYDAMLWLLARQEKIEKKLAARHLGEGATALYDVTSSYYEGRTCPLAVFGHNRDRKDGNTIIVYGALCDADGRPVAVQVYPGNTADPATVPDQAQKLRHRFGLERVTLVGDRGMLTQTQIDKLRAYPGLSWISALRSKSIGALVHSGSLQLSLFDERDLAEITSPLFPGERLVACYNPALAAQRKRKREELIAATEKELGGIAAQTARRTKTPLNKSEIGLKVGRVINRHKVAKHFKTAIGDGSFSFERRHAAIEREAALDGIYVIRTSEPASRLTAEDAVRGYKNLSRVEQAFRTLKSLDLLVRPIRHHTEEHVRAHIFLCTLAYYVEWHMRKALAPVLFEDEELEASRKQRDPVKPAQPSASVKRKKAVKRTPDGFPVHSFRTLIEELGTLCKNRCKVKNDPDSPAFDQDTTPTDFQQHVFNLLALCPVNGN